jgi:carboxyl-terminal processing protease
MRRIFVVWVVSLLLCPTDASAQTPVQSKAVVAKRMIERNHFSPRPVDDSFSNAIFRSLLKKTDSRRMLFTDAEYRSLSAYRLSIDDELQGKGWVFYNVFETLYKKALTRADSIINSLTQKPFDFSKDESISFSKTEVFNYATDVAALANRWSRYLKFIALNQLYDIAAADTTGKTTLKMAITKSEAAVRARVKANEIKTLKKITEHPSGYSSYVTEIFLDALATGFDPHTNYFSPQGKQQFQEALSTEALSFGFDLGENEKGQIVIERLTPGGPAWKSGDLNKGDELLNLHWEGKEAVEMTGLTLEEAYEVLEQTGAERIVVKVKKADGTIKITLLRKEKIDNEENIVKGFVLKGEKKIGYILLPGFYTEWENESGSSCANDVAKEIVKLKKENIDGLILDVRFNGGGSLGEAMEMIGIFIDEGPLMGEKERNGKLVYLKDPNRGTIYSGPMVLMVNGQSASASELLAGALQDYNRAVIVGSNTFGKATMQQMFPMDTMQSNPIKAGSRNDMVKITTGKLYRLNGETAQLNGVKPDVVLPDAFDGIDYREKYMAFALAAEGGVKNNYYKPLPALPVSELAKKSAERIAADPSFQEIQKIVVATRSRRSKEETISLRPEAFEQWYKQQEAEMDIMEGTAKAPGKKFTPDNHSLDKALLINNEYAKEVNNFWLNDIAENIYIQEAFLVLCDLIKLKQ